MDRLSSRLRAGLLLLLAASIAPSAPAYAEDPLQPGEAFVTIFQAQPTRAASPSSISRAPSAASSICAALAFRLRAQGG